MRAQKEDEPRALQVGHRRDALKQRIVLETHGGCGLQTPDAHRRAQHSKPMLDWSAPNCLSKRRRARRGEVSSSELGTPRMGVHVT